MLIVKGSFKKVLVRVLMTVFVTFNYVFAFCFHKIAIFIFFVIGFCLVIIHNFTNVIFYEILFIVAVF